MRINVDPPATQVTLQTESATLSRLAKASMSTGYQLANAEMRLLLERGASAVDCSPATDSRCDGPRLSSSERSRLSPTAAAHIAALEARLVRLEERCGGGGARAEQVSNIVADVDQVPGPLTKSA